MAVDLDELRQLDIRVAINSLAANLWPVDDLAVRARKVSAVLRAAGAPPIVDDVTVAHVEDVLATFEKVVDGKQVLHLRTDGSYELRHVAQRPPGANRRGWGSGKRGRR